MSLKILVVFCTWSRLKLSFNSKLTRCLLYAPTLGIHAPLQCPCPPYRKYWICHWLYIILNVSNNLSVAPYCTQHSCTSIISCTGSTPCGGCLLPISIHIKFLFQIKIIYTLQGHVLYVHHLSATDHVHENTCCILHNKYTIIELLSKTKSPRVYCVLLGVPKNVSPPPLLAKFNSFNCVYLT